jgi:hypothetical protein
MWKMKKMLAVLAVCLMGVAAQAVLIDDFSGDLSAYTKTRLLDNGQPAANVSFTNASGDLRVLYTGTPDAAEQVAFLRSDRGLAIGERLYVNTINLDTTGGHMELGLMVAATATPVEFTRTNYVTMNIRNQTTDRLASQWANTTAYVNNVQIDKDYSLVGALYIKRIDALNFETGWYDKAGVRSIIRTITVASSDVGNVVGFYADMRSITPGMHGALDNLQIIPEPATLVMLGLGALGLLKRRKA